MLPATLTDSFGLIRPQFGRTQYRFGAVVLTLKQTSSEDGFDSLRMVVTTSLNGPEIQEDKNIQF